jgi:hypothetical protein
MLQNFKTPTLPYRGAQAPAPGPDYSLEELFKIFTGFLHRQYPVIIAAFLLIMTLAASISSRRRRASPLLRN